MRTLPKLISDTMGARQAVRRQRLGIRGRLLQPDGARHRREKSDHHGLRAKTVMPAGASSYIFLCRTLGVRLRTSECFAAANPWEAQSA